VVPGRSSLRPRWLLVSCATRWRSIVAIRFASPIRCQWSTLIRAAGRAVSRADRNVAEGSIATTSIRSRQAGVRASSQPWMPVLLRPSTMPRTRPVSVMTNPVAGRDFVHGAARVQHGIGQVFPQPGQAPRPGRELLDGLGERLPPAPVLGAHHAGLPDHHLDPITAGRDVTDPLLHPGMHPGRDHPAVRAPLVPLDRLHNHTPATQRQVDRTPTSKATSRLALRHDHAQLRSAGLPPCCRPLFAPPGPGAVKAKTGCHRTLRSPRLHGRLDLSAPPRYIPGRVDHFSFSFTFHDR
jgi:hypothetical protein